MNAETVILRIAKECRANIVVFDGWKSRGRWLNKGAIAEARGMVAICQELLVMLRQMRREIRKQRKVP